jgi:hypothetical protein
MALGFAAGCLLSAGTPSHLTEVRPARLESLAQAEAPPRVEAGPAGSGPQDLRPVHAPKVPSRHAPAFHKGAPEDAPGAPAGGPSEDLAPTPPAVFRALVPAAGATWVGRPRTFSPQGLKPEQGGQTGPPGTRVSA